MLREPTERSVLDFLTSTSMLAPLMVLHRNPYISLMIYKDSEAFFLIASEENEVSWDGADYGASISFNNCVRENNVWTHVVCKERVGARDSE